jgi:hypothetical protein
MLPCKTVLPQAVRVVQVAKMEAAVVALAWVVLFLTRVH